MQKKQVAVLDVGSSSIKAVVGERGINKTFVIKGEKEFLHDGYQDGEFLDLDGFKACLIETINFLKKTYRSTLNTIYVGVPGAFTEVIIKESQISFSKKKTISDIDVDALFDAAFVIKSTKSSLINRSAIVYELDDCRRLANPVGEVSEILKGTLSFVLCSNYFLEIIRSTAKLLGISKVEFVSSTLAEAMFLVDADMRDRIVQILDVGYISTTFSIVQGDGILYQKSFDYGGGYITASMTELLEIPFDEAEQLKRKINLSRKSINGLDIIDNGNGQCYNAEDIKKEIKKSLDVLCENVSLATEESGYIIPEYVPLLITGGGVSYIRGAKEHISGRLNSIVEVLVPQTPLLEKPIMASILSLLDLALNQNA